MSDSGNFILSSGRVFYPISRCTVSQSRGCRRIIRPQNTYTLVRFQSRVPPPRPRTTARRTMCLPLAPIAKLIERPVMPPKCPRRPSTNRHHASLVSATQPASSCNYYENSHALAVYRKFASSSVDQGDKVGPNFRLFFTGSSMVNGQKPL